EPDFLTEADRGGIAAMLPADAQLDVGPSRPALLGRHAYQFPHALDVERNEGVLVDDAFLPVDFQEGRGVIAGYAEGRLRQVIRAEREELRRFSHDMSTNGGARQLDHRAGQILYLRSRFLHDAAGYGVNPRLDVVQLLHEADQRYHDFGN